MLRPRWPLVVWQVGALTQVQREAFEDSLHTLATLVMRTVGKADSKVPLTPAATKRAGILLDVLYDSMRYPVAGTEGVDRVDLVVCCCPGAPLSVVGMCAPRRGPLLCCAVSPMPFHISEDATIACGVACYLVEQCKARVLTPVMLDFLMTYCTEVLSVSEDSVPGCVCVCLCVRGGCE
jgi:hypothetical protein